MLPGGPIASLLAALGALIIACCARAAEPSTSPRSLPAAASPAAEPSQPSHGWLALPQARGSGALLAHLPPRRALPGGFAAAPDGTIRVATLLEELPEALAAFDNGVAMIFSRQPGPDGPQRRVLAISARSTGIEGGWSYGGRGRLESLPTLRHAGELLGAAGTAQGPIALLAGEAGAELWWCVEGRWVQVPMPEGSADARRVLLGPWGPGVALGVVGGEASAVWLGTLKPLATPIVGPPSRVGGRAATGTMVSASWDRRDVVWPAIADEPVWLAVVRGVPVLAQAGPESPQRGIDLWRLEGPNPRLIRELRIDADRFAAIGLEDPGRLAVVWLESPPQAEPSTVAQPRPAIPLAPRSSEQPRPPSGPLIDAARMRVAEVSALTGEVLYQGPVRAGGPVSGMELKVVAVVLVAALAMVLLLVMRPGDQGPPIHLPRGVALAEPGARILAGLIDLVVVAMGASLATGVSVGRMFSVLAWMTEPGALEGLVIMLGSGVVYGTVLEGLTGRTVGKALCGCRVVRAVMVRGSDNTLTPALARPGLARSLVRNVVRWMLPPMAFVGMSSAEGRHRGDLASGTVVVSMETKGPNEAGEGRGEE